LISAPILSYPDFEKLFIVLTDASMLELGAILAQKDDQNREVVIRYASRRTNDAERNYAPTQVEQLAVVWAVKYFRKYLMGNYFKIITDYQAITSLMNTKDPTGLTARWICALQEYTFEVIHRAGRKHTNINTLSRLLI